MTKKPLSPKHGKPLPDKHRRDLTNDDYVERDRGVEFSDSDIFANQGVSPRTSDHESREERALHTRAEFEKIAAREARERLEQLDDEELRRLAESYRIARHQDMNRDELIGELSQAG